MNGYNEEQPVREEELKPKQRVIKFRAWDGKNMFFPSQITFDACGWHVEKGRGVSIPYQPHVVLIQFTGILDKDRKEIYEGDIRREVVDLGLDESETMYFIMTYVEEWSMFAWLSYSDGEYQKYLKHGAETLDTVMYWSYPAGQEDQSKFDVIGNIYQHKHLLP